ncbi:MAG: sel1 repeat family protein, partial [Caulobacterales bacterium]|nr:sel1 repeat family protein [Caulobacterales bacterium]
MFFTINTAFTSNIAKANEKLNIDNINAATELDTSCQMGSSGSCHNAGVLYIRNKGINPDYKRAKNFFIKGCKMGNMSSCNNLGSLYF